MEGRTRPCLGERLSLCGSTCSLPELFLAVLPLGLGEEEEGLAGPPSWEGLLKKGEEGFGDLERIGDLPRGLVELCLFLR